MFVIFELGAAIELLRFYRFNIKFQIFGMCSGFIVGEDEPILTIICDVPSLN